MKLPRTILMYPMTLASQAAHVVMRFQQGLAELVIKGDNTLETLFPPKDEKPEWATFDEDLPDALEGTSIPLLGLSDASEAKNDDRRSDGRFALYSVSDTPETTTASRSADRSTNPKTAKHPKSAAKPTVPTPAVAAELDYPALTLAQLQARLHARCPRARGPAGLRAGHQGPCPVPDAARQQDHPRDCEVTQNSAENPFPVRAVAIRVAGWIDKLGAVWVEGQLAQITMRPDAKTVFMVLRDPAADMSLTVTCSRDLVLSAPVKLAEGVQVVVCGKPSFYTGRGTFSLRLSEIRAVGIGELLARIDRLRRLLDAEGLFDPRLKRPIPYLPNMIGLITGRASAAERDVTTVASALASGTFRRPQRRRAGPQRRRPDRRGAARARSRPGRRRDRAGPGRRLRRGPAAVF